MCLVTHGNPYVKMHVLLRHMESHACDTWHARVLNCVQIGGFTTSLWQKRTGGKKRKGKGEKKERKERKERKRKRKREKGKRPAVSSLVHWCSNGQNSLNQGVKSEDSTRGYASSGRNFSYFGLLLAFGLLFLG